MVQIHGFCKDRFSAVKDAFQQNFKTTKEVGASFAATVGGELVVDIWGGHMDETRMREWEENTLVNVYSTTKIMGALCVHLLVDRGLIDLDAPVAEYWPEFGQNGKENVLVRHVLSHSTGLPAFGEKIEPDDLYRWDKMCNMLAAQKPRWEPGTKAGYQMITHSFLVGNLVKLVSGKSIASFFHDEIAQPFGFDFSIGASPDKDERIAPLVLKPVGKLLPTLLKILVPKIAQVVLNPNPNRLLDQVNTQAWRDAELCSSNGHGNGRSLAQIGALLACGGGFKGKRLLSEETVDNSIALEISGRDKVNVVKTDWGLGWALNPPHHSLGSRSFAWSGYGGSWLVMDREKRASAGYAMNYCYSLTKPDPRAQRLIEAFREVL